MKLYSCPYEIKPCSLNNPNLVAQIDQPTTVSTNSTYFKIYSICSWTIKSSDFYGGNTLSDNSYVSLGINSYTNSYVYINNGTKASKAAS